VETQLCRNPAEFEAWDDFVESCPGAHYFQYHGWLSSYAPMGLECEVLTGTRGGRIVAGAAFVSFQIPLLPTRVFILPHGPVCRPGEAGAFAAIMTALEAHFRARNAVYVQAWPHVPTGDPAGFAPYAEAGYTGPRLFHAHEFGSTLLAVDIGSRSEEQVLAESRRNTRYYGRASRRTGLELRLGRSQEDLDECHRVWSETADHHGFSARPLSSFRIIVDRLVRRDKGVLVEARKDGELAGAILVLFIGGAAVYSAGGMRRSFAALHPAEFMHLEAMRIGRERGLQTYDFNNWGSEGTRLFKSGFRPREQEWEPPRTRLIRPLLARAAGWGERHCMHLLRRLARFRASRRG
jgi:lipid II:glycine glycyltransferase (peptidoglycan interpeptide bridge formation enzyme)